MTDAIELARVTKMVALEVAAQKAWAALSADERRAYLAANPRAMFAERAVDPNNLTGAKKRSGHDWFKSLSPKQQAEYKKLHPKSKLGQGGGDGGKTAGDARKTAKPKQYISGQRHDIIAHTHAAIRSAGFDKPYKSNNEGHPFHQFSLPNGKSLGARHVQALHKNLTNLGYTNNDAQDPSHYAHHLSGHEIDVGDEGVTHWHPVKR